VPAYHVEMPGLDVEYTCVVYFEDKITLVPVRGFQVGLFAVRRIPDRSPISGPSGAAMNAGARVWVVDHMPSHMAIVNVASFDEAMVIADDLSRFAPEDSAEATNWGELDKALGPLVDWCRELVQGVRSTLGGYRAFRDKQDPYLLEVAIELELPYEEVAARHRAGDEGVKYLRHQVKCRNFFGSMNGPR
jgi:hypothetical protein